MNISYRPIGNDWQGQRLGWGSRRRTPFKAGWQQTLTLLYRELAALGAADVVFQLDMAERDIRVDGFPRRDARPRSPAVIISFKSRHGWLRYQCDAFEGGVEGWQDNVRAIALGLEALRQVERYGITKRGEQYTGWKALPDSTMTVDAARDWIRDHGGSIAEALRQTHPDHGGTTGDLNRTLEARKLLA